MIGTLGYFRINQVGIVCNVSQNFLGSNPPLIHLAANVRSWLKVIAFIRILFYRLLVKICRSAHEVDVDHSGLSIKATLSTHMILWCMQTSSLVSLSYIQSSFAMFCPRLSIQVILKVLWQLSALGSSSTMIPSDRNPCLRIIKLQSIEGFPCTDEAFWHWVRPWLVGAPKQPMSLCWCFDMPISES